MDRGANPKTVHQRGLRKLRIRQKFFRIFLQRDEGYKFNAGRRCPGRGKNSGRAVASGQARRVQGQPLRKFKNH